jgi:hypothetical protein
MKSNKFFLLALVFIIFISINFAYAWEFNGTIKDINGNALNNTLINITIWTMGAGPPTLNCSNSTTSDGNGWFTMEVSENPSWFYKPVIIHTNGSTGEIDFIGQSLPDFPYSEFVNITGINFYLKRAGTINITSINRTGGRNVFNYQVKDTKLGYPIAESWQNYVSEAIVYVPADRNYSIMIYPNESLPVSFDWNNFTSTEDYSFGQGLSSYNASTKVVQKQFNCTEQFIIVNGTISSPGIDGWTEFTIIPFILEPGNMIYLGENAAMPYNMSAWNVTPYSDSYDYSTGYYEITLPASAESINYILFATGINDSKFYGGFRNVSLPWGSSISDVNFTMYGLLGRESNITMHDSSNWGNIYINTSKKSFRIVNSSDSLLTQTQAHIEVKVDYSNYGAREFTYMTDVQSGGIFSIPLLNITGVKEMNVYCMDYAPKNVQTKSVSEILSDNNITLSRFNPRALDGTVGSSISIDLYTSNSTCNVANPPLGCSLVGSGTNMETFNPLSPIIGGGALSFRMGLGGVLVHYVNVDMLASGPPDALFEDNNDITESTSNGFSKAMRFGSSGPRIYEYVLISIPYTQGSSSTSGLNESSDINVTVRNFYDEGWNLIWSASNGTNASALAGNYSHYSEHSSEWNTLMQINNCTRTWAEFDSSRPCYVDTSINRIWVRLPHFSGTQPSISGNAIVVSSDNNNNDDSSGGSGTPASTYWTSTYVYDEKELKDKGALTREIRIRNRIRIKVNGSTHYVGVVELTNTTVKINVTSKPQQATFSIGEENRFELTNDTYYDLYIKLNDINNSRANITIKYIQEEMPSSLQTTSEDSETEDTLGDESTDTTDEENSGDDKGEGESLWWLWTLIAIVVVVAGGVAGYFIYQKYNK